MSALALHIQVTQQCTQPPFPMSNHPQAVVLDDHIYMGGGFAPSEDVATVLEFDPCKLEWKKLAKCPTKYFGMAVMKKKLFVVAGTEISGRTKTGRVYSWDSESMEWKPFPGTSMLAYRSTPSVVSYAERWLIAIGGEDKNGQILNSVERLDIDETPDHKRHWLYCSKLPIKCAHFSSAVVGNKLYTFGTTTHGATSRVGMPSNSVFCAPLDILLSSEANTGAVWQEIMHLPLKASTALSFNGSLLALGGIEMASIGKASSYIYKLEYDDQESPKPVWKKAGDLPCALYQCAGTQFLNNIFVHGIGSTSAVSEAHVYLYALV